METNISTADRIFRLLFGIAAALYILLSLEYEYFLWGLIALFPIVTAIINWCPLYHFFGFSNNKTCH